MKKYLCMLLAFALVLGLAGCGNGDPETSGLPDASVENSDGPAYEDGATPSDLLPATPEPTPTPDPEPIETLKVCGISIVKNGQLGSAVQEVARSKGLLAGMRAVKFTADGEVVDLSDFLGNAAEEEEEESVEAASAAAAVADELSAKDGE